MCEAANMITMPLMRLIILLSGHLLVNNGQIIMPKESEGSVRWSKALDQWPLTSGFMELIEVYASWQIIIGVK